MGNARRAAAIHLCDAFINHGVKSWGVHSNF
jgi:hypothetical protein